MRLSHQQQNKPRSDEIFHIPTLFLELRIFFIKKILFVFFVLPLKAAFVLSVVKSSSFFLLNDGIGRSAI